MAEYRLGYDLRFAFADFVPAQWPPERRARFLLRPEIERPASVDALVWPSRFVFPGSFIARHPDGLASVPAELEHMLQNSLNLWSETAPMWARFRQAKPPGAAVPVMITLMGDSDLPRRDGWAALIDSATAAEAADTNWPRLGYDVADKALTSGLANCGYDDGEVDDLRRAWGPRLNDYGLFDRLDDADTFRVACDARVPEHRPFRVFGLYRGSV